MMTKKIRYLLWLITSGLFLVSWNCFAETAIEESTQNPIATTAVQTVPAQADTAKPAAANKFLQFLLTAKAGKVKLLNAEKGIYELDLSGVSDTTMYFSNRPRRIVGNMPTGFFLKRWIKPPPHDFKTTPPNAALIYANSANHEPVVIELMDPVYDADKKSVVFSFALLSKEKLNTSEPLKNPVITMAEITVCGVFGAWGNLPGEKQYDEECHTEAH